MKRLMIALSAIVVFAAACGGGDSETAGDVLAELGLSDSELACFEEQFPSSGLDMDEVLSSNPDDLTTEERQTVVDTAADCAAAQAIADAADDAGEGGDEPAEATTTAAPVETTTPTTEAPTDDEGETRSYDDLSGFEQAFVDGITESGGSVEAGICILDEFEAAGISLLEVLELATGEPTPEMLAAIFSCGEELLDAGLFDGAGGSGDTYGDNASLDLLWDQCETGDLEACDELYWTSPVGSEYEAFGSTCGDTMPLTRGNCATADTGGSVEGGNYGDDPILDALWDSCALGDLESCDTLWFDSPIGSEYEAFGASCGGVESSPQFGTCADGSEPMNYGDDAELDGLYDACTGGDLDACDELYLFSPIGSAYETYGNTCGGRSTEDLFGTCASELG